MADKKKLMVDVEVVKRLMDEKSMDEKKLAELMKVTPQTIKRFFKADNHLYYSVAVLFKIARALEVSIPTIIHEDCKKLPDEK